MTEERIFILHFNALNQIRKTDMPERMQLRNVPITSVEEGSTELDMEADWIYKHAFSRASISKQVLRSSLLQIDVIIIFCFLFLFSEWSCRWSRESY